MTDRHSDPMPTMRGPSPSRRRLWVGIGIGVSLFGVAAVLAVYFLMGRWDRDKALNLAKQGQFSAAEPLLIAVAEREPDDVEVVKALVRGYLKADDPIKAAPYVKRWCQLRPDQMEAAQTRFSVALQLLQAEELIEAGQNLLAFDPKNIVVRGQLANLCLSLGRLDEAEQNLRHCLEATPDDTGLRLKLIVVLHQKGQRAEAETLADQLLSQGQTSADLLMTRSLLHLDADQPDRAIPLLRQVLDKDPAQERFALYHLVVALKRNRQDDEAARMESRLNKYRELQGLLTESAYRPDDLPLQARAAEALFEVGRDREAIALLEAALKRDPNFTAAHRLLAVWYDKHGQPDKAAQHRRQTGDPP